MELRKDYIEDRWVIINPERGKRPHKFKKTNSKSESGNCTFCLGSEHITTKEIGRISDKTGKWKMRWFGNKYPVVELKGGSNFKTKRDYFTSSNAYGKHEVIVETNDHKKQLWDLSEKDFVQLLEIYKHRTEELSKIPKIRYVSVFKNHGIAAGTSIMHSHSQIVAYNIVPNKIKNLLKAVERFHHCPYCDIIKLENKGKRRVFQNEDFAAFCPYASRFQYEVWIFPKRHVSTILELTVRETMNLAKIMKSILGKLKSLNADYNYFLNYSPENEDLHFHIRINPRMSVWAGFEWSTDTVVNSVSPEEAASFYRKK